MISRKVHSICSFISIYRNGYTETQKKKKKIILMNIFTDRIRVYLLRFFLLNRFLFSSALNIFATIAVIQQNISELHFSLYTACWKVKSKLPANGKEIWSCT